MKRSTILTLAVAGLSIAALIGTSRAQSSRPAGGATVHLAVCDVAAVFTKYQRATDLSNDFQARRERIKAEDDDKAKQMEQQDAMLKELTASSKKYEEELQKLERLTIERQVWRKMQETTVTREYGELTQQMYEEITAIIAEIAKEQGIDVVLYRDSVELKSDTPTELLGKIALRKVLYSDPSIDITQSVLDQVNATYKAGKK